MGKRFTFHVSEWIVDTMHHSAEESGFYVRLCLWIIDSKGGFVDADDKTLARRCGCTPAKARRVLDQLMRYGSDFRIEDGKIYSAKCSEIIAEMEKRDRRLPWPEWGRRRAAVFARDQDRCVYCGTEEGPFECDHIVPVSRGGTNDLENLATACVTCNRDKRDSTVEEWRPGQTQLN
jgi:uncharacterized protein YdaU (DUF1376 family)